MCNVLINTVIYSLISLHLLKLAVSDAFICLENWRKNNVLSTFLEYTVSSIFMISYHCGNISGSKRLMKQGIIPTRARTSG
jgi:hypothetical protein